MRHAQGKKQQRKKSTARTTAVEIMIKLPAAYAVNQQQTHAKSRCDDVP